ncbi:Manganese/iron superoxide dismutase, C-terminal,Manganese/iron superoxide [Cinara cedri]|uniref:Superoxide dismutase n=1 Tax=Cinara cedri TaxID=506608 RepID=A0A5E4MK89_9HEMI|nr:Manganese/iron superoxide dismutase, C-terminal,Manganese/iron superoxide [Cinara cedri]
MNLHRPNTTGTLLQQFPEELNMTAEKKSNETAPTRTFSNVSCIMKEPVGASQVTLPPLPYGWKSLEPTIPRNMMELNPENNHSSNVVNYNKAVAKFKPSSVSNHSLTMLELINVLKFNIGDHINRTLFWNSRTPHPTKPSFELQNAIVESFRLLEEFKKTRSSVFVSIQGLGWGWLVFDPNEQNPESKIKLILNQKIIYKNEIIRLFGYDIWEQEYFLQYKNVRVQYVNAMFVVVNWTEVSDQISNAKRILFAFVD